MKQQSGFTLIELIVVIVILGILAATAMPKLVGMSSDANKAVVNGLDGSMRSANAMIFAAAATAQPAQLGPTGVIAISGVAGNLANPACVDANNNPGICLAYGYASSVADIAAYMDVSPTTNFDMGVFNLQQAVLNTAPTSATCGVTYTPAISQNQAPGYVDTYSGC